MRYFPPPPVCLPLIVGSLPYSTVSTNGVDIKRWSEAGNYAIFHFRLLTGDIDR